VQFYPLMNIDKSIHT